MYFLFVLCTILIVYIVGYFEKLLIFFPIEIKANGKFSKWVLIFGLGFSCLTLAMYPITTYYIIPIGLLLYALGLIVWYFYVIGGIVICLGVIIRFWFMLYIMIPIFTLMFVRILVTYYSVLDNPLNIRTWYSLCTDSGYRYSILHYISEILNDGNGTSKQLVMFKILAVMQWVILLLILL